MSDSPSPPPPPDSPDQPSPPPSESTSGGVRGSAGESPPPPPPSSGGGGGGGGGGSSSFNIGDALKFGWERFQENVGPIVIGAVGLFVAYAIVVIAWNLIIGGLLNLGNDAGLFVGLLATAVLMLMLVAAGFVLQGIFIRAGFDLVDGRGLDTGRLFSTEKIGPIVITGVLVSVGVAIGYVLCVLPGLIFAFVSAFSLHFVIDEDLGPTDAIRASIEFVRDNLGDTIVLWLVTSIVSGIGAILCGVGLLVTFPVALIAQAYGFRQIRGHQVPAVS